MLLSLAIADLNTFTFDEATHTYKIKDMIGQRYEVPGATRCLDHAGLTDYSTVKAEILERKSAIGKAVHDATVYFDQNDLDFDALTHPVRGYVESYIAFCAKFKFSAAAIEDRQIGTIENMMFGMQLDRFGFVHSANCDDEAVIELKTTTTLMPHHAIQLALYAAGYKSSNPKENSSSAIRFRMRKRFAVKLHPQGKLPEVREFTDKNDYDVALAALRVTIFKMMNKQKLPEITNDDDSEAAGAATSS